MKKYLALVFSLAIFSLPALVLAQTTVGINDLGIEEVGTSIMTIINGTIMPLIIALGVLFIVWGIITYMTGKSDDAKKEGKDRIIFGIIGLAVIVSIWGLVAVLVNSFGLGTGGRPVDIYLPTTPLPVNTY